MGPPHISEHMPASSAKPNAETRTTPDSEPPRLHALDAIRTAALLLGICLHACLSFIPGLSAEVWPISDVQKSTALTLAAFVIHVFRMSVFFLMAGFFARLLFCREGTRGFLRNRAARIVAPLVLGWVVCLVLIGAVVLWTIARANGGELPPPDSLRTPNPGFMHLWFLYLLLWLYAIVLAARSALRVIDPSEWLVGRADQALRFAFSSRIGPVMLALPIAVALGLITDWVRETGVPTPGYTLVPPLIPLFVYLYVFAMGWLLDRQRQLLTALGSRWPLNFALGLVGALVCVHLLGPDAASQPRVPLEFVKPVYAAAYGLALTCWTLAFVGAGVRYLSGKSAVIRYVADASYWMYIMHLPLVMGLQAAFMSIDLHWSIKFALINVLTCLVLLVTYHWGVRATWVGRLLNGRRLGLGAPKGPDAQPAT